MCFVLLALEWSADGEALQGPTMEHFIRSRAPFEGSREGSDVKYLARCSNEAFATLLTDLFYLPGTLALIHGIRKYQSCRRDIVVLVPIDWVELKELEAILRRFCVRIVGVKSIKNPYQVAKKFQDGRLARDYSVFMKLHVFNLTEYSRVLFVDSDQIVLQSYDELFTYQPFAAPPQLNGKYFQSNLFLLHPRLGLLEKMLQQTHVLPRLGGYGDQGFLNSFFKSVWGRDGHNIPWYLVANRRWKLKHPQKWNRFQGRMLGVECSGPKQQKPWANGWWNQPGYTQLYRRWWDIFDEAICASNTSVRAEPRLVTIDWVNTQISNDCPQSSCNAKY